MTSILDGRETGAASQMSRACRNRFIHSHTHPQKTNGILLRNIPLFFFWKGSGGNLFFFSKKKRFPGSYFFSSYFNLFNCFLAAATCPLLGYFLMSLLSTMRAVRLSPRAAKDSPWR